MMNNMGLGMIVGLAIDFCCISFVHSRAVEVLAVREKVR
tara:strand:+ start:4761 stop:4877 length:117 start_codon:yes stop_codon:yes gene_type:complete